MFITLEGIEGVGKTTHLQAIAQYLREKGHLVVVTREPGGTLMGEEIRNIVLSHHIENVFPMTELLLLFAARMQHIETVIRPALLRGEWVLCDRFIDASYAYQGGGRGLSLDIIKQLEQLVVKDCLPNLTFIFDANVEIGLSRVKKRQQTADRIEQEKIDFFERVRQTYLQRAHLNKNRYCVIDAEKTLSEVEKTVLDYLAKWIENCVAH